MEDVTETASPRDTANAIDDLQPKGDEIESLFDSLRLRRRSEDALRATQLRLRQSQVFPDFFHGIIWPRLPALP